MDDARELAEALVDAAAADREGDDEARALPSEEDVGVWAVLEDGDPDDARMRRYGLRRERGDGWQTVTTTLLVRLASQISWEL